MLDVSVQSENISFQEIVIEAKGILDSTCHIDFYDFVKREEARGFKKFIFDFNELESISSAGISILIRLRKKFKEANSAIICIRLRPEVEELFYFLGFHKTFLLASDKESAEKLLESIYFLQKSSRTDGASKPLINRNRFGMEEGRKAIPTLVEMKESKEEIVTKKQTIITEILDEKVIEPSPFIDPLPPLAEKIEEIEEIKTEPYFKNTSGKSSGFTIPFITKSFGYDNNVDNIKDSIVEEEDFENNSEKFKEIIINCGNCGTKIRIRKQGIQKCPTCFSRFHLRQSGSISSIEKL